MSLAEWLKNGWLIEHYRVIQSLKFTLKTEDKIIQTLDAFRKKRNVSEYSHAGAVTAIELDEISVLAGNLRKSVEAWIVAEYPSLRP